MNLLCKMVCAPYKFYSDPSPGGVLYAGGYYSEGGYYMPVYTVVMDPATPNSATYENSDAKGRFYVDE
jgi:hypothetical protein